MPSYPTSFCSPQKPQQINITEQDSVLQDVDMILNYYIFDIQGKLIAKVDNNKPLDIIMHDYHSGIYLIS